MKKAVIFGASGDLGSAFELELRNRGFEVNPFGRSEILRESSTPIKALGSFDSKEFYDVYIFCMGKFTVKPFVEFSEKEIDEEFEANTILPIKLALNILKACVASDRRQDLVFIGSTSAYEGFANTVPYSSAKFALRGLVSALNSEYKNSQRRFFLASMGTMQSKMGKKLIEQDFSTFLMPNRVATRILDGVLDETGNFEPEIIIRRRVIR
jgi:short-subunit dehydrogenase